MSPNGTDDTTRYRVIVWRNDGTDWLERLLILPRTNGWHFSGSVVGVDPDLPEPRSFDAQYHVRVDRQWRTRSAVVTLRRADAQKTVRLRADGVGGWTVDDQPAPEIAGCLDVDIAITPLTNTLAIRRLDPAVGEQCTLTTAWVTFPDLTVVPNPQRYTRLTTDRWRFESLEPDGTPGFTAEITFAADGFVARYGDLWQRVRTEPI